MYKRKRRRKRRYVRKQQGGFGFRSDRAGRGIRSLPPFKILRAVKAIHDFTKQKIRIQNI